MTVTYSTFDSLQGSFYPLSLDRPPHDIDLNTFLSHAPWMSSWVSQVSSPVPTYTATLRLDLNALRILLTTVYQSQHLIHIWHSPFVALPQSERIFCASHSHLWPHTAYYHLAVTIATFYSYHFMVYLTHPAHTATLRLELNALFAFRPGKHRQS